MKIQRANFCFLLLRNTAYAGCATLRLADATIAKNYLAEHEVKALNLIVSVRLVFAELQATSRTPMHMRGRINTLDDFLKLSERDILTHAGKISHEIPWGAEFASDDDDNEELGPYKERSGGTWGRGPIVEVLSHRYAWENYRSSMNRAGGCSVPSRAFSEVFDLRSAPSQFSQYDTNGSLAAISLAPPEGCDRDGNILYVREDLLRQYANARKTELVWAVWGERNLRNLGFGRPDWCYEIYQRYGHLWRHIVKFGK